MIGACENARADRRAAIDDEGGREGGREGARVLVEAAGRGCVIYRIRCHKVARDDGNAHRIAQTRIAPQGVRADNDGCRRDYRQRWLLTVLLELVRSFVDVGRGSCTDVGQVRGRRGEGGEKNRRWIVPSEREAEPALLARMLPKGAPGFCEMGLRGGSFLGGGA